jgi:hypothetical protein
MDGQGRNCQTPLPLYAELSLSMQALSPRMQWEMVIDNGLKYLND